MTPDPYKALREQARRLKHHTDAAHQLITTRNNLIRQLRNEGHPIVHIAKAAGVSRETIYQITKDNK